jgi:hypothetical protein
MGTALHPKDKGDFDHQIALDIIKEDMREQMRHPLTGEPNQRSAILVAMPVEVMRSVAMGDDGSIEHLQGIITKRYIRYIEDDRQQLENNRARRRIQRRSDSAEVEEGVPKEGVLKSEGST